MYIKTLGIDIAKNIFQVHGIDYSGNKIINKAISRTLVQPSRRYI